MADATGIDKTAVMFGQFLIGSVELRIVQMGFDDAVFEIIQRQAMGHAAEEFKHVDVRSDKALLVLLERKLHELVTTKRQGGNKGMDGFVVTRQWIEQQTDFTIIELCFTARINFKATGGFVSRDDDLMMTDKVFKRTVTDLA